MTTIEEAIERLVAQADDGVNCPCCGQMVKIYKRKLNSSMAFALIQIYKFFLSDLSEWLHVPSYLAGLPISPGARAAIRGDWAKLKYWGFIDEKPTSVAEDATNRAGFWKITKAGKRFVQGLDSVPRFVYLYDGKLVRFSSEKTTIQIALGDRFDFIELMRGT